MDNNLQNYEKIDNIEFNNNLNIGSKFKNKARRGSGRGLAHAEECFKQRKLFKEYEQWLKINDSCLLDCKIIVSYYEWLNLRLNKSGLPAGHVTKNALYKKYIA